MFDPDGRRIAQYVETTGALIREYVWIGWEPVAVVEGGVVSFVRADHIGRPVFATNASGVKVWSATYLPFGGVHVSTGSAPANRFPGQWFQSESGLHQNWMRDYDPTTGRYLEPDPLGLVDGASVYGYVRQNPGRWIDPTGTETTVTVWGGAGWGGSSFGHASATVNGTAYTYGPGGMSEMPDEDYDARNDFRDGIGIELDLSPEQERQFEQCLAKDQGAYSAWSNNCTDPIETCLAEIGYDVGDSLTPTSMLLEILTGDIPKKPQTVWKDAANPAECGCAPWVK